MKYLFIILFSSSVFAEKITYNPENEVFYCYIDKEEIFFKKLSWEDLKKETIYLQHKSLKLSLKPKEAVNGLQIMFGKAEPDSEFPVYTGGFTLSDEGTGGGQGDNRVFIVKKNILGTKLGELCTGQKYTELTLIK